MKYVKRKGFLNIFFIFQHQYMIKIKRNIIFQQKRDLYSELSNQNKIIHENEEIEQENDPNESKMREIEETIDKYYIEFTSQKCEVEDQDAILTALKKIIDEAKENRKN